MFVLRIYLVGIIILAGAIGINAVTSLLGWSTWYTLLTSAAEKDLCQALGEIHLLNAVFLLVGYPALLGLLAHAGDRHIFKAITRLVGMK